MVLKRAKKNRRRGETAWRRVLMLLREQRAGHKVLLLLITALVAGGLPVLGYVGWQYVTASDYFQAKHVTVHGLEALSEADVMTMLGSDGEALSLLEADEEALAARLEAHPWIAKATVRITLPNTLEIELDERAPFGVVFDGELFWVDAEGRVIEPLAPEQALDGPVVSGFEGRLREGDAAAQAAALEGFRLIRQYRALGLDRWAPLAEVHFDAQLGYTLFTDGEEGMEIRLGRDRLDARLERLWQVFETLEAREMQAEYILLDQRHDLDRVVIKPVPRVVQTPPPPEVLPGEAAAPAQVGR